MDRLNSVLFKQNPIVYCCGHVLICMTALVSLRDKAAFASKQTGLRVRPLLPPSRTRKS